MKNIYRILTRYDLRKSFAALLFLVSLASLPVQTFAQVTGLTLKSVNVEVDNNGTAGSYVAASSFMPGQSFVVYFGSTVVGTTTSYSYIVQLSDNTGSFANPVTISAPMSFKSNATNANIKILCTIPFTSPAGSYLIRLSNSPSTVTSATSSISVSAAVNGFGIGTGINGSPINTFNLTPAMCGTHFYNNNGTSNIYLELSKPTTAGSQPTAVNNNNTSSAGNNTSVALVPPTGYTLVLTFNTFDIDPDMSGDDAMQVFNGPTTSGTLLAYAGNGPPPGPFTSTDPSGALAVNFVTDASAGGNGWDATITFIVPTPTGSSTQTACSGATVADLTATVVAGAGVNWYDASSGGSLLGPTTPLVNGTHYFASQTAGTCESTGRLDVTVTVTSPAAPVATAGTGATTSQITANWGSVGGATGYFLDVATDNGFSSIVPGYNNLNVGNVTTLNVTGLSASTPYFYRVRETNGTCTSANSNTISYTTTGASCPFVGGFVTTPFVIICNGGTATLTVTGSTGNNYGWQISSDNTNWSDISGATTTTYTTASGDGSANKFYRLMSKSTSCWNVTSNVAEVDVSNTTIAVSATNIADNNLTLNWGPVGSGNYNITYSGTSSGLQTGVTPPKTITGLTANGGYNFVVTQTGVTGGCSASGTLNVNTLCAVPTNLTATPTTVGPIQELNVSWNGPAGNYRVFYRPLYSAVTFYTKDVTNATSVVLTKQGNNNLYGSNTYQVYVASLDCPNPGNLGQPTSSIYVTTNPTSVPGCATPTIDTVFSTCPVLLEVQLHGGSGIYNVYIQRLTPTLQAVNSYGITGGDFVINAAAGQQYLISADSKCGSVVSTLNIWHNTLTVKPICNAPGNLVLSSPTCRGFTASWNADQCIANTVSAYALSMRQVGSINFNSYGVALPVSPLDPHVTITLLAPGKNMQVFVRSVYTCNGAVTYGPSSQTETITTQSAGCRDEEPTDQLQENKPAVQQYSTDNQEVFSLYPNPNTGEFTVDLGRLSNSTDEVRIEVLNLIGQTLITHITSISDGHMSEFINLPKGTAAGTYIVRLTAGKNVYTAKVNITR